MRVGWLSWQHGFEQCDWQNNTRPPPPAQGSWELILYYPNGPSVITAEVGGWYITDFEDWGWGHEPRNGGTSPVYTLVFRIVGPLSASQLTKQREKVTVLVGPGWLLCTEYRIIP